MDVFLDHVYGTLYYYPAVSVKAYMDGIEKFNEITSDVARQENLVYANVSKGIDYNKSIFIDNYHLTPKGSEIFAENYFNVISGLIKNKMKISDKI